MKIEATQWVIVYPGRNKPYIATTTFWSRRKLIEHYGRKAWARRPKLGHYAAKCHVIVDLPEPEAEHAHDRNG